MAGNSEPLSPRAKLAVTAGKAAAAVSRAAGRGSGSVIGGRVALKLDPDLLGAARAAPGRHPRVGDQRQDHDDPADRRGAAGRRARSSPTRSAPTCPPASPRRWPAARTPSYGVIEVDEKYLAGVARDTDAQGDRAAQPLPRPARPRRRDPDARREVARGPGRHRRPSIVANADDPLIVWAASSSPERGVGRGRPGVEGRRLVLPVLRRCDAAPRRRLVLRRVRLPPARRRSWALHGDHVLDPHGSAWPIHLQLPGRANKANAATSAAVAAAFGVPPQVALERMYQVQAVAGRYDVVHLPAAASCGCCWRRTRPAGWRRSP